MVFNATDARLVEGFARLGPSVPLRPVATADSVHVAAGAVCLGGTALFGREVLGLAGRHNEGNLCVALGALSYHGIDLVGDRERIASAVSTFKPFNYRLTPIADPSGLLFVDDTLATVPEATVHAIQAYADRPLTVIVGGNDRGVAYELLRDFLVEHGIVATIIGLPESGPRILDVLKTVGTLTLLGASDLDEARRMARECTPAGGVVLMSPAAPSYGQFDNYEHRSRVFREAVARTSPSS